MDISAEALATSLAVLDIADRPDILRNRLGGLEINPISSLRQSPQCNVEIAAGKFFQLRTR
jgi:hypothetical protein